MLFTLPESFLPFKKKFRPHEIGWASQGRVWLRGHFCKQQKDATGWVSGLQCTFVKKSKRKVYCTSRKPQLMMKMYFFSNTGHFHASLSYLYILSKKKNITKWEVLGNWTQTDGPLTQGQWKRIYRTSRFWLVEGLWGYWRIWHGEECRGVSVQSKWFIWMSLFRASSIQGASIDQKLQSEDTAGHAACRV